MAYEPNEALRQHSAFMLGFKHGKRSNSMAFNSDSGEIKLKMMSMTDGVWDLLIAMAPTPFDPNMFVGLPFDCVCLTWRWKGAAFQAFVKVGDTGDLSIGAGTSLLLRRGILGV